jgi:cyclopropane-fatty-acyl-phospholipid synthase
MRSQILTGEVNHCRFKPVLHSFDYPAFCLLVDLDELNSLSKLYPVFGYNRRSMLSLWDKDYAGKENGTIKEKMLKLIKDEGLNYNISRISLVTTPRYFGYVFNPVSFYYCYDQQDKLVAFVSEVHNTFAEAHFYILKTDSPQNEGLYRRLSFSKEFYVSPFFDTKGEYEILVKEGEDQVDVKISLFKESECVFNAKLLCNGGKLTRKNLIKTAISYPLNIWLTSWRIHKHAIKLYFQKKLFVYLKPEPKGKHTAQYIRSSVIHRARMKLLSWAKRKRDV